MRTFNTDFAKPFVKQSTVDAKKIDASKFMFIFKSLDIQMKKQTSILESILTIEKEKVADDDRARKLDEMKRDEEMMRRKADEQLNNSGQSNDQNRINPDVEPASGFGKGLAAFLGFEMGKGNLSKIWDVAIRAGFLGIIAKPLSDFLGGVVSQSLNKLGLDSAVADQAGDIIADTGVALMIGKMLGKVMNKRLAMMLSIGGLLYTKLDDIFDRDKDGMVELFGSQFSVKYVQSFGAIIGSVAAVYLPQILRAGLALLFKRAIPFAITTIGASSVAIAGAMSSAATTAATWTGAAATAAVSSSSAPLAVAAAPVAITLGAGGAAAAKVGRFEPYLNKAQEVAAKGSFEQAADIMKQAEVDLKEPLPVSLEGTRYPQFWTQPNVQYEIKKKIATEKLMEGTPNPYTNKDDTFTPIPSPSTPIIPVLPPPPKQEIEDFLKSSAVKDKSKYNILSNQITNYLKATEAPPASGKAPTINDNKSNSIIHKGGDSVTTINNIVTPPSYSLNHFLPR